MEINNKSAVFAIKYRQAVQGAIQNGLLLLLNLIKYMIGRGGVPGGNSGMHKPEAGDKKQEEQKRDSGISAQMGDQETAAN